MDQTIFNKVYTHVQVEIEKNKHIKKSYTLDVFYIFSISELKTLSEDALNELNSKLFDKFEAEGYKVNRERKKVYWNGTEAKK